MPLAAAAHEGWWGSAATAWSWLAYAVGAIVCHQRSERSFHLATTPLPVCARCTGLYLGAALVALCVTGRSPRLPAPPSRGLVWLVAAAGPTVATLVFEWTTGVTPSNLARAACGLALGGSVSWLIVAALAGDDERTGLAGPWPSSRSE